MTQPYIRHGFGAVRPYLYGHADLPDFVRAVFGGEELERTPHKAGGCNVEMRVGDSVLVIEAGPFAGPAEKTIASVYVYVEAVDSAYAAALRLGAESIQAPAERPWGERLGGARDTFGNTWWIATAKSKTVFPPAPSRE